MHKKRASKTFFQTVEGWKAEIHVPADAAVVYGVNGNNHADNGESITSFGANGRVSPKSGQGKPHQKDL